MSGRRALVVVACLALPASAMAHGGGLDVHGCHHNRMTGDYHCHRGPLAGQHFSSQAEMLQHLQGSGATREREGAATAPGAGSAERGGTERRLRELNELRDKGLVTPEEYETKRREIL